MKLLLEDTSVKKIFVLSVVHGVPENHNDKTVLFNLLNFNSVVESHIDITVDFKRGNILVSVSTCAVSHLCLYCDAKKNNLYLKYQMRTYESIRDYYNELVNSGGKK